MKQQKQIKDMVPGAPNSIKVSDGLNRAIRIWKKQLKDSDTINELFERKEHIKPSYKRRKQLETAKFKQSKQNGSI